MQTQISKRISFYRYIKERFKPTLVYYPASGYDRIPKRVFGKYRVIHLSLPQHEKSTGYLKKLGDGIKILGDMSHSPLADNSVDMILIHYSAIYLSDEMLADFDRVLKPNGIVTVDGYGWTCNNRSIWNQFYEWFKQYKLLNLPKEFHTNQNLYGVRRDEEDYGWYVSSEKEMIDYVTTYKRHTGFNEILDYAVFQKPSTKIP